MVISYTGLLHLALPEVIVVLTSILVIAVDLLALRRSSIKNPLHRSQPPSRRCRRCAVAIADLILAPQQDYVLDGVFLAYHGTAFIQIALLILSIFTLLLTADSDFTTHAGEFVLLILLATVGMMFLVATTDLLIIFISLELLSLSLYILSAFNKQERPFLRSSAQILLVRRNVRRLLTVRLQSLLRPRKLHQPVGHLPRDPKSEPAIGHRVEDDPQAGGVCEAAEETEAEQ